MCVTQVHFFAFYLSVVQGLQSKQTQNKQNYNKKTSFVSGSQVSCWIRISRHPLRQTVVVQFKNLIFNKCQVLKNRFLINEV